MKSYEPYCANEDTEFWNCSTIATATRKETNVRTNTAQLGQRIELTSGQLALERKLQSKIAPVLNCLRNCAPRYLILNNGSLGLLK